MKDLSVALFWFKERNGGKKEGLKKFQNIYI